MIRRGTLVTIVQSGSYGKPRPALVIQSNLFSEHPSVTVLPVTSELRDVPLFRIRIEPTPDNGLKVASEIMVDKMTTIAREKVGESFGRIDDVALLAVTRAMMIFLGLA